MDKTTEEKILDLLYEIEGSLEKANETAGKTLKEIEEIKEKLEIIKTITIFKIKKKEE